MCATELTLGHLDSASRQDTQGRDGPTGAEGRASRGSIRTVQLDADGMHTTSVLELRQASGLIGAREANGQKNEAEGSLMQAQRDQKNNTAYAANASNEAMPRGTAPADPQQSARRSRNEH